MARSYVGILSRGAAQVERFVARAEVTPETHQPIRSRLGEWHLAVDFRGSSEDLFYDAGRLLLIDRPASGGASGPVDARVRRSAAALDETPTDRLMEVLHDPVAFVRASADGTVALFRGLFAGRTIFYATIDEAIVFGSELGLVQQRLRSPRVDAAGMAEILLMRWSAGTQSLVEGIRQVLPGQLVMFSQAQVVECRFAVRPRFAAQPAGWSLAEAVTATEAALRAELRALASRVPKAVVPLSAGVDSSLILSLAREEFAEVVAITGDWEGAGNPELESARQIAAGLGVTHVGATIRDGDIPELWSTVAARLAPVPRRLSALPLLACFRHPAAQDGIVLYGEAADTLFGSAQIGWLAREQRRRNRLLALPRWQQRGLNGLASLIGRAPGRLVPRLLDHTESQLFVLDSSIEYQLPPKLHFPGFPEVLDLPAGFELLEQEHVALTPEQRSQDYLLRIDIPDHLIMLERLVDAAGVEAINLFTTPSVQEVAASLGRSLLSGDGRSKPVLRALAGRYVPRAVIEAPKLGFPTPNVHWLRQPLSLEVAEMRGFAASGAGSWWVSPRLATLPVEADPDAWWMALGLWRTLQALAVGPPVEARGTGNAK